MANPVQHPEPPKQIQKHSDQVRPRRGQLQFLSFQLTSDTRAMLSATHLTEILPLPAQDVVPIPDTQPWVLGAYNWRGEILWVVDLAMLLGLGSTSKMERAHHKLMITHTFESRLGLAVQDVEDMFWCNPDQIESAPANTVTAALAPVLQGYTLGPMGEMLLVLDAPAVQQRALQLSESSEL